MSENRPVRPVRRNPDDSNSRKSVPASARPRTGAESTQRVRPAGSRVYDKAQQAAHPAAARRRPAAGTQGTRTQNGVKKPVKKKTRYKVDYQALVLLIVMALLAIGILVLLIIGTKNCDGCATEEREYSVTASIYKEGSRTEVAATAQTSTEDPQQTQTAENTTSGDNGQTQPDVPVTPIPTIAATAAVSVPTNGNLRSCTIRTVGDFVISKEIYECARTYSKSVGSEAKYDFSYMLSQISDVMGNADWTVANVDGSMGDHYKYGYSDYPQFNTPSDLCLALKGAGVDMLTMANNHMLDGWFDGLKYALDNVDQKGLKHIGASRTQEERNTPDIIEINGIKVGFLNYTESLNNFENYGVDQKALDFGCHWVKNADAAKDVRTLKAAGAEVIVCYMHWGTEYDSNPDANERKYANDLVKAGVDIIVGGHPHVVQKAEWLSGTNQFGEMQKTFCVYSLGNYLSDHYKVKGTEGGIIFEFTIREKQNGGFEIVNPCYIPTYVWQNGTKDKNFVVVNAAAHVAAGTRPSGMDNDSYNKMVASYNYQVGVMNQGVGTLKTK